MGFATPQIQKAVKKHLEEKGRMFENVGSLAELLLDEEDREEREAEAAMEAQENGTNIVSSVNAEISANNVVESGTALLPPKNGHRSPESGYNSLEEPSVAAIA